MANATEIKILTIGSPVGVGYPIATADLVPGTVTAVMIGGENAVTYRIAWWDGRTRREEWLTEGEIAPQKKAEFVRVGFQNPVQVPSC